MPHPHKRILFALAEPGYFRMYGSVITEMTRRGWTVAVAFEKPERRGATPPLPASAGSPIETLARSPHDVSPFASALRAGIDYVHYLEPAFAQATYLRRRAERYLPPRLQFLTRVGQVPSRGIGAAIAASRLIEGSLPPNRAATAFLEEAGADLLFVSPLVAFGVTGANQTELIKAARARRIPVIVGVASWDHLTSKGMVRVLPDALLVWNETQQSEAVQLHRVPASRVVVTGSQAFDHWFEPVSEHAVCCFMRSLGIERGRPTLLVVGSSPKMAPGDSEVLFVRRWLEAIRASNQPAVRDAFVIVRPHPGNTAPWRHVDLADPAAVIHPRTYPNFPLTDEEIDMFRCSLAGSTAVIGVNTTAMIEAAILRKPVLTVRDMAFDHSQRQTLHFAYLEQGHGGFAISADSLPEHVAQLERVVTGAADATAGDRFVERFVRPLGMQQSAKMHVCDTIERFGRLEPRAAHQRKCDSALSKSTR
jgi:hypothetical protein